MLLVFSAWAHGTIHVYIYIYIYIYIYMEYEMAIIYLCLYMIFVLVKKGYDRDKSSCSTILYSSLPTYTEIGTDHLDIGHHPI